MFIALFDMRRTFQKNYVIARSAERDVAISLYNPSKC